MEGQAKPPPAGWYVDPDDEALQRFWNGSKWTNSRMPRDGGVLLEGEAPEPAAPSRYASDPVASRAAAPDAVTDPASGLPPAAWYDDPENPSGMRYWDGSEWTEHKTNYRVAPPKKKTAGEGMVIAGYVLAVMLPVVGVVLGLMLINRQSRHGRYVLGLSVLCFVGFFILGQSIEAPEN